MANEIVKYNNDMNKIGLRNFNSSELDILMAIMSRMKEKGLEIIEFDFDYLKELTKWNDTDYNSFVKTLDSTYQKLININLKIGDEVKWTRFVLFTEYTIDTKNKSINIGVNSKFKWVLNELTKNFTRFELEEFINFKSSYTKEFFRRMKQFRGSGKWEVSLEDFKHQLNIPEKYLISDIDKRILTPILNELKEKYHLKIKKKYDNKRKGRPSVNGFVFTFTKEIVENKGHNLDGTVEYETNLELHEVNYKNRMISIKDQKFDRLNFLRILSVIRLENNKIRVKFRNVDDNYENFMEFDNLDIWNKYFIKNSM